MPYHFNSKMIYDKLKENMIAKKLFWIAVNFVSFLMVTVLYIIKPFKHIKLLKIRNERFGHLAVMTDTFLRRIKLKIIDNKNVSYVGISSGWNSSEQMLKMFSRLMFIIQLPKFDFLDTLLNCVFSNKSFFGRSIFFHETSFKSNEFYEYNNTTPNIFFTPDEELKGRSLLREMGIQKNNWFVCFHSRDYSYLNYLDKTYDWSYHSYRDSSIKNYIKAAKYIASQGGFAVRMGAVIQEKLGDLNNSRIIDYASVCRSDFGDIYLPSKCKFFLGSNAGLSVVPLLFHVPVALANYVPYSNTPFRKGDLFIFKKIWSNKKSRFLTFREIFNSEIKGWHFTWQYEQAGLSVIENSAEEILDLAKEMNGLIDGTFKRKNEDEILQQKFHSLIKPDSVCYGTPARIGTMFLRKNMGLLK